jgi:hypothetical protein
MGDDLLAGARGTSPVSDGWRFYRLAVMRVAAGILGPGYGTIGVLVWVLDYYIHNNGSVIGLVGGLTVIVSWFAGITWLCLRTGVRETDEGLVAFSNFSRSSVRWDDVAAFEIGNPVWWKRAVARRRSGETVTLPLAPDRRVTWRGGWTYDAVAVLNQRLDEVRRTESQTKPEPGRLTSHHDDEL